jgi:hypothetical protein
MFLTIIFSFKLRSFNIFVQVQLSTFDWFLQLFLHIFIMIKQFYIQHEINKYTLTNYDAKNIINIEKWQHD